MKLWLTEKDWTYILEDVNTERHSVVRTGLQQQSAELWRMKLEDPNRLQIKCRLAGNKVEIQGGTPAVESVRRYISICKEVDRSRGTLVKFSAWIVAMGVAVAGLFLPIK